MNLIQNKTFHMGVEENVKIYIPKKDTQQADFLRKYPKFDGRGIKIAIIDSAIDLSLPGMQKTTNGLPKIVDCVDFTESGKIDTSTIKEMENGGDGTLCGLSGRKFEIPSAWKNPSGKWHLGMTSSTKLCLDFKNAVSSNNISQNHEINLIEKINTDSEDFNFEIDCIVWNDGKKWRTCLIPFSSPDFEASKILTNFWDEQGHSFLFDKKFNYCVTIKDGGNAVHVYCSNFFHGTSVAHIAAAHFPDEKNNAQKDGLAPGAQVYSIVVPFGRKMSREKVEKAFLKCIEWKIDIVNISMDFMDELNFYEILKTTVEEHGMIITKSAGNRGPDNFSIKCEEYSDNVFVIGALNPVEMKLKGGFFSHLSPYSSRGPSPTGARGISYLAPGAAITSMPRWHQFENGGVLGTSFAAPNAAGAIACLLSALKAFQFHILRQP